MRQTQNACGRSAWGFFSCQRQLDSSTGEALLHTTPEKGPPITIARPYTSDLLQHGPFAFKLSPSSEVLAWLVAGPLRASLQGKRVLEVGAGLGYTGVACAAWADCASVLVTDGDLISVGALRRNVELNAARFGSTVVEAAQLKYGSVVTASSAAGEGHGCGGEGRPLFDCILCADCVYDRYFHVPLLTTLKRSLHPAGQVLVVASRRKSPTSPHPVPPLPCPLPASQVFLCSSLLTNQMLP